MAKNEEYKGSIDLISGLRPKNGANFPLVEAADILTGGNDKRLDADLANIFAQLLTMATQEYVQSKIAELVASSPEALDTLNELAAALGNDPNFATTVLNQLGTKVDKVAGKGLSTNDFTTDLLNRLYNTATVKNGEFYEGDNITVVSSGHEITDSKINIKDVMIFKYVWFADIDVVADTSSISITNLTATPIGSINDFKGRVNALAVMSGTYDSTNSKVKINLSPEDGIVKVASASSYYESLSAKGIAAAAELAVIKSSLYNCTMFNAGDILFTTGVSGVNYKRLPMHEVKYNAEKGIELMGLSSPWDKQQINKVPTLATNLSNLTNSFNSLKSSVTNMPQQVTFHTEEALLNWISVYGVHYCVAQAGNGANPLGDEYGLEYLIHVGREYDSKAFTGKRFQLAMHIRTGKLFYRVGSVSSGGSFGSYTWLRLADGYMTEIENESITEEKLNGVVLDRMTEVIECTQADIDAGKNMYRFSGTYRNVRYINSRYGGTSLMFPEEAPERNSAEHYKAYHIEILQEYEGCEESSAFNSAFDMRAAGHYDVDIVYDFVNSKWRVTNYIVKPYAEGSE